MLRRQPRLRRRARPGRATPRSVVEPMEPRVLYAADLAAQVLSMTAGEADAAQPFQRRWAVDSAARDAAPQALATATAAPELVVVDARVPDAEALLAGLAAERDAGRPLQVLRLGDGDDAWERIGAALEAGSPDTRFAAIHLIGHGADGRMVLGATTLDEASLLQHAGQAAGWAAHLSQDADVLLYGCDVASTPNGQALLTALAALTGADVAASDDATGSQELGGDAELEQRTGAIEASVLLQAPALAGWQGLLATQVNEIVVQAGDGAALAREQRIAGNEPGSLDALAVDALGNPILTWTSVADDGSTDILAQVFDSAGRALSPLLSVADDGGNHRFANVAADAAGNFVVVWQADAGDGDGKAVMARRYTAGGVAAGAAFVVSQTTVGDQAMPAVAMQRSTGNFVVAWHGSGVDAVSGMVDATGIWYRTFNADGTASAGERHADGDAAGTNVASVVPRTGGVQQNAAVAMDSSGRFVVAWDLASMPYFRRFNADGSASGGVVMAGELKSIFPVGDTWTVATDVSVALADSGMVRMAYWENAPYYDTGLNLRSFANTSGVTMVLDQQNDATRPNVSMDPVTGGFAVSWDRSGSASDASIDANDVQVAIFSPTSGLISSGSAGGAYGAVQGTSIAYLGPTAWAVAWGGPTAVGTQDVTLRIQAQGPDITSNGGGATASVAVAEGNTLVTTVQATDDGRPASPVVFSIAGGADAALFTIDPATGVLRFRTAPDYEQRGSAAGSNVYVVAVGAGDGVFTDVQTIQVTVGNVIESAAPQPDRMGAESGVPIQLDVLANDRAGDNPPIVLDASTPAHGTITLPNGTAAGGTIGYTATSGWSGTDSFSYLIDDGTRSLVNYWRLDGNANDVFGRATGTVQGTPGFVAGDLGLGFLASGDDGIVLNGVTTTAQQTVVLRFRVDGDNSGGGWRTLWHQGGYSTKNSMMVFMAGKGYTGSAALTNKLVVSVNSSTTLMTTGTVIAIDADPLLDGGWHQLAVSMDASGTKAYVDGSTTAYTSTLGSSKLPTTAYIGRDDTGSPNYAWKGMIDSVARYSVALTAAQSASLYQRTGLTQVQVDVVPANLAAPVFQQPADADSVTLQQPEGRTAVTALRATDADTDAVIRYAITGGADAALFSVDAVSGALRFLAAPDFEHPQDAGADNRYEVIVSAQDGKFQDALTLTIQVTNVVEPITAHDDSASTTQASPVSIDALANDVAGDGSAPRVLETTKPAHGSVAIGSDGKLTYTPDGTIGDFGFDYLLSDSSDALKHYWRLEGNVTDLITGRTSSNGGTGVTAGRWGNALAFRGGEWVDLADPGWGSQGNTISLWFNVSDLSSGDRRMLYSVGDVDSTGGGIGVWFTGGAGDHRLRTVVRAVGNALDPSDLTALEVPVNGTVTLADGSTRALALADGQWHQYVLVVDPLAGTQVYVDGVLLRSDAGRGLGTVATAGGARLGGDHTSTAVNSLVGAMDGVGIFQRSMSASDVAEWYSGAARVGTVTVSVTETAQTPPVITSNGGASSVTFALDENQTAIATLTALDADIPVQTLAWSLLPGGDASAFRIDPATGELRFQSAPDHEQPVDADRDNVYEFSVSVSDGRLSATQAWRVTVRPVNDHAPVITSNGGEATVRLDVLENLTAIARLTAQDADIPAASTSLGWALAAGGDAALFSIDAVTGELRWRAAPDAEAPPADADGDGLYQFEVIVSDGQFEDRQGWTLGLQSVNDVAPVMTGFGGLGEAHLAVDENTRSVGFAAAFDGDTPPTSLTWTLHGADAEAFLLHPDTRELTFVSPPDREVAHDADGDHVYQVILRVEDGSFAVEQTLHIAVRPLDEAAPVITSNGGGSAAVIEVPENTVLVTTATATDEDAGEPPLVWSIVAGADRHLFDIEAATGRLTFRTAPDFEQPQAAGGGNDYHVTIQASGTARATTQDLTIRVLGVDEHAPVFTSAHGPAPIGLSVAENVADVAVLTASDADLPTTSLNWSIRGGADGALFRIGADGVLRFAAAPDHEQPRDGDRDNVYEVEVAVADPAGHEALQAYRITVLPVNEAAPVITSEGGLATAQIEVAENNALVTTATATDADLPSSTLTWSIVGGADRALFTIDAASGQLAFIDAPDFEQPRDGGQDNVYDVTIAVDDGEGMATEQAIAVRVTPVNEHAPVIISDGGGASAVIEVAENTTAVTTGSATDADTPAPVLTWSIVGGADRARFVIDAASGQLSFIEAPDFERPVDAGRDNVYDVSIAATDEGGLRDTQALAVRVQPVNDHPPTLTVDGIVEGTQGLLRVAENETLITRLRADDADLPAANLVFSIVGGADADRFEVDAATGVLSWKVPADREQPRSANGDNRYDVIVAVDDGALQAHQALIVEVGDVDDTAPQVLLNRLVIDGVQVRWDLRFADVDTAPEALRLRVGGLQGGHVERLSDPNRPITAFTAADWLAGDIRFVVDAAGVTPGLTLTVADAGREVESQAEVGGWWTQPAAAPAAPTAAPTPAPKPSAAPPAAAPTPAPTPAAAPSAAPAAIAEAPPAKAAAEPAAEADHASAVPTEATETGRRTGRGFVLDMAATFATAKAESASVAVRVGGVSVLQTAMTWNDWRLLLPADDASSQGGSRSAGSLFGIDDVRRRDGLAAALDDLRAQASSDDRRDAVGTTAGTLLTSSLSVGYVIWLARGGVLIASMMSSLPVWAGIDPLPVLRQGHGGADGGDGSDGDGDAADDELEHLFDQGGTQAARAGAAAAPSTGPGPAPGRLEALDAIASARRGASAAAAGIPSAGVVA